MTAEWIVCANCITLTLCSGLVTAFTDRAFAEDAINMSQYTWIVVYAGVFVSSLLALFASSAFE